MYRIAKYLEAANPIAFSQYFAAQFTLHEQWLMRAGFIYTNPLRWRYLRDRTISLLSKQLPPRLQYDDSYLIDGDVLQYAADPTLRPPLCPHTLSISDRLAKAPGPPHLRPRMMRTLRRCPRLSLPLGVSSLD